MLTNCLAASTHLSSTVSQLFIRECKKSSPFSRTAANIFVFPGEAPAIITQYLHGWKDNSMLAKRFAHVPIYLQQFPSYTMMKSMRKSKNRYFYDIFVSPGDALATMQHVPWMERQFNACQTPRSMYLSIFNSFQVLRCLSQCVSPKIAFYHIFVSLGDVPGAITLNVVWMEREFDAYKLSRCMCPSNYYRF